MAHEVSESELITVLSQVKHPEFDEYNLAELGMYSQIDVNGVELENIRRTARLLDGNYEDPEIDKSISVDGIPPSLITEV